MHQRHRLLYVLPDSGQFDADLDECGRGGVSRYDHVVRRAFRNGVSFDFNYTWSHSIDNGSSAESGAGKQGAAIQNIFNTGEFRGSSDFDIRHNISANYLFELPIGKNKALFGNASGVLDHIIGGWQLSSVMRYRTGLPTTVGRQSRIQRQLLAEFSGDSEESCKKPE